MPERTMIGNTQYPLADVWQWLRMPLQRVRDWLHERRIAQLRERLIYAQEGERVEAWVALRMAINSRSADQVVRMEREKGIG